LSLVHLISALADSQSRRSFLVAVPLGENGSVGEQLRIVGVAILATVEIFSGGASGIDDRDLVPVLLTPVCDCLQGLLSSLRALLSTAKNSDSP
jgi:hypothetical protein